LLNDDHKISNENKLMLEKEAKRKGVLIILASTANSSYG
jgi:hydroxymethylpyrimidine pyrophosphatase-like HAD family hydrolase